MQYARLRFWRSCGWIANCQTCQLRLHSLMSCELPYSPLYDRDCLSNWPSYQQTLMKHEVDVRGKFEVLERFLTRVWWGLVWSCCGVNEVVVLVILGFSLWWGLVLRYSWGLEDVDGFVRLWFWWGWVEKLDFPDQLISKHSRNTRLGVYLRFWREQVYLEVFNEG